jgi:MFS family permease
MFRLGKLVVALCAVQVVDVMGVTVVVSALPRMLVDLHASPAQAGLLVPGYAVGFSSLLLLSAKLGDRHGHRRTLVAGLVLFAAGSVLAAIAPTMAVLVVGRVVQGLAAAVSVPNALVLLSQATDEGPARDRALGIWSASGGFAGAIGLIVGGLATSIVGWRAIFWGNLLVTAVLVTVLLVLVDRDDRTTRSTPINLSSVLLQVGAIAAVVAAANTTSTSWLLPVALTACAAIAATVLVRRERRANSPLVPAGLWRRWGVGAGLIGSFGITATTSGFVIVATVYLQETEGFSPAAASLMILPFSASVVVAAIIAGRLTPVLGARRALVIGLVTIGVGAAVATIWPTPPVVVAAMALGGAGNGLGAVAAYALGTAVPNDWQGSASGLLNTAAQMGTAVLVAVAVAVGTATSGSGRLDERAAWLVVCGTAVAVIAAVLRTSRPSSDDTSDATPSEPEPVQAKSNTSGNARTTDQAQTAYTSR